MFDLIGSELNALSLVVVSVQKLAEYFTVASMENLKRDDASNPLQNVTNVYVNA